MLSLGSAVVSVATLLYVTLFPGSVSIYMPKQIAVQAVKWQLAVNASLLNTAAQSNVKIIEGVSLKLALGAGSQTFDCSWLGTMELITTLDYGKRYKEVKGPAKDLPDQFGPLNRPAPFSLKGKELLAKIFVFDCQKAGGVIVAMPKPVQMRVTMSVATTNTMPVITLNSTYTSDEHVYDLTQQDIESSRKDGSSTWVPSADEPQSKK